MEITSLTAFATVSVLLVLVPGSDWAYVIAAGLRDRSAIPAVSGLLLGYAGVTAIVAAGLATAIARTPTLLTGLTIAGAAYLIWLGASALARPGGPVAAADDVGTRSARLILLQGAGVSGLNPKGLLLFLALMPQFVTDSGSWPIAVQLTALGLLHVLVCGVVYSGVATGARTVLRSRPTAARIVTRSSGAVMILIGAILLAERLR